MPKARAAKPMIISAGASVLFLLIALITGVNA